MNHGLKDLTLLIDGVIFQLQRGKSGGISNVWKSLLDSIVLENRFKKVLLLDRGDSPKIPGIETIPFQKLVEDKFNEDSTEIEKVCAERGVDFFISTYFTAPRSVYSISYLHDFIPEKMGMNLNQIGWLLKSWVIDRASGYIGVSSTTLDDFRALHPRYKSRPRALVYNSITEDYRAHSDQEVSVLKAKHGINKRYFVVLGQRATYKNALHFFKGFSQLANTQDFQIVCVGGYKEIEYINLFYIRPFNDVMKLQLDNQDLSTLLSGAEALIYPSIYEGFGMPILEAQASGCPVIVSQQAQACLEVGGEAVIAVDGFNVEEMTQALERVQQPEVRRTLIERGFRNTERFSKEKTLQQFYAAITENLPGIEKARLRRS